MKKSIFKSIVIASILTVFTQTEAMGQITPPYTIYNNNPTGCAVDVTWELIDANMMGVCNTTCHTSGGNITILAGNSITLTAADFALCSGVCNIVVTFVSVGSSVLNASVDDGTNHSQYINLSGIPDCNNNNYDFNVQWTTTGTVIY
ncbi:MAG: hypothetical protein KF900_14800 [Bacteroidetes bacterium]|nr:hypothetical protein [Bacteroidota bacterium]